MRVSVARTLGLACAFAATVVVGTSGEARAGIAWGDASLRGDEVRLEIDGAAHATITHVVSVHVAAKKFRAFVLDGVDEGAQAPLDEQTVNAMDGPGWPIAVLDTKGESFEGFAEPAKEPRKLRVHLGQDGVPRGDYTITLRYRVDMSAHVQRDGPSAFVTWSAPSWPEGYDNGRIVFVLPTAPMEPRVSLVDGAGGEPRSIEGAALLDVQRQATIDELTLVRPHVPHHDDVQWVLSFDPKAMPEATANVPTIDRSTPIAPPTRAPVRLDLVVAIAVALGIVGASIVARRDRDAMRLAAFRPLVPIDVTLRATIFGALVGGSSIACLLGRTTISAAGLVGALIVATLRPPAIDLGPTRMGRWLAMPASAVPRRPRPPSAPIDPSTWLGATIFVLALIVLGAACVLVGREHADRSAIIAMHGLALLWPFATGRASQCAPDLVRDAWMRLRPVSRLLERSMRGRVRIVGHVPRGGTLDEVRIRVAPDDLAARAGVMDVEIGCAIVAGVGGASLVPQLLVRTRRGSPGALAFERRIAPARASATFSTSDGRDATERVIAIRPAFVSPRALRHWVRWALAEAVRPEPVATAPARSSRPSPSTSVRLPLTTAEHLT
jgi:hypothetical protein